MTTLTLSAFRPIPDDMTGFAMRQVAVIMGPYGCIAPNDVHIETAYWSAKHQCWRDDGHDRLGDS